MVDHPDYLDRQPGEAGRSVVKTVNAVVAIAAGLLVLLGYFAPGVFADVRDIILQWAVVLAGFALLVGIANMLRVHWKKTRSRQRGSGYSLVLIVSLLVTLVVVGLFGPTGDWSLWLFNWIQVPVENSLMAILAIVLLYAAARLLRRRPNTFTIVFAITVFLILLGTAPFFILGEVSLLGQVRTWLVQVPAAAGARGLLLGVALGTIAAGLRVLMGVDRPYGG